MLGPEFDLTDAERAELEERPNGGVFADPLGFVLLVEQCQNANSKEKHTR